MLVRLAQGVLALVMSMVAMAAHAVTYDISTVSDGAPPQVDGECSIREAIEAINTQTAVDTCPAGTGGDQITLEAGETYLLSGGELSIGGEQDAQGQNINVSVRIKVPDSEEDEPAILDMNGGSRAFYVHEGSSLLLDAVSARNGVAAPDPVTGEPTEDGGLVLSEGVFSLRNGGSLSNGWALKGGLVKATGPVRVIEGALFRGGKAEQDGGAIYLHGEASLALLDSRIQGSTAGMNGGAVALAVDFLGELGVRNSLLDGNVAQAGDGGALYFRGERLRFQLINSSFLANEAPSGTGAIHVGDVLTQTGDPGDQDIDINNVTVADSLSGGGFGSVHVKAGDEEDAILNSVVVGDRGNGDCSGVISSGYVDPTPGDDSDNVVVEYSVLGNGCADPQQGGSSGQDMTALRGLDAFGEMAVCGGATTNVESCDPADLEPFPGYLPELTGLDAPWGNGNPELQTLGSCLTRDQRGISRLDNTCDAGAIEFSVARGADDEFIVLQGRTVVLDMGVNDVGDGRIDCRRASVEAEALDPFHLSHQSNEPGDNDLNNNGIDDASEDPLDRYDVDDCAQVMILPSRSGARVRFVEDPENKGRILLEYTPGSSFHGLDRVGYRINRAAFEPTREDYATRSGRHVEGLVFIVSEPASGMTESESIEQLGAMGGFSLLLLIALGFVRRGCRWVSGVSLLLVASFAGAAEIRVTTLKDNFDPSDGVCSVREALYSSIDEQLNLEPACGDGQGGRDTVILPRGCIQLGAGDGPLLVESPVKIVGEAAHRLDARNLPAQSNYYNSVDPENTTCRQDENWTKGSVLVGNGDQILDVASSLILESVSLFGGNSSANGGAMRVAANLTLKEVEFFRNSAENLGGALYLAGLPDDTQEVNIDRAYFLENQSLVSGGAMALSGAAGYTIKVADTTLEANRAEQSGGAMLLNSGGGGVQFANVLVFGNVAGLGAGGLDISLLQGGVDIMNGTIVNNIGGSVGGMDLGASVSARTVDMTNSIHALNYVWDSPDPGNIYDPSGTHPKTLNGDCSSTASGNAEPVLGRSSNNLFSSAVDYDLECAASQRDSDEQLVADETDIPAEYVTDGGGALFTARNFPESEPVFIPPNLAVRVASVWIKNLGYDGKLGSAFNDVELCRQEDARGLTRTSGGRCDRGAYEVQETTAVDDEARNQGYSRADILVDILDNDSTDPVEGQKLLPETVNVTLPSPQEGAVMVLKTNPNVLCDPSEEGYEEGCVLRYHPEDPTPLDPDNEDETPMACISPDAEEERVLTYDVQASLPAGGAETSNTAQVTVALKNLRPRIANVARDNKPGGTLVIRLDVTDPFNGEVTASQFTNTLKVEKAPLFAAQDESGEYLGTGLKLNTPAPGYITYVSGDTTKRFRDRFQVSVEDSCGMKSVGGQITIRYENEDVSGGDLLAGGASVAPFALLLLVGGFRRRVRR